MFRLARPFSRMARPWNLAAHAPKGQVVRVERVKVKQARPATRFLGTIFKGAAVGYFILVVAPAVIPDDGEHEDHHDEEQGNELFIPFPGTTKTLPGQPYMKNSPEVREFARISQDPKLQNQLKRDTIMLAYKVISVNPVLKLRVGQPSRATKAWLELDYPAVGPPEYERSGILITDDLVGWATVACDSATAKRLQRFLWPQDVAVGVWAVGTSMVKEAVMEWIRYFGFASEGSQGDQSRPNVETPVAPASSSSIVSPVQREIERLRREAARRSDEMSGSDSASSSTGRPAPNDPKTLGIPGKPAVQQGDADAAVGTGSEMPKAIKDGVLAYRKSWRPLKPDPPRGCVCVSGRVEFEAPKAWITVDIVAWYNPKTKGIDTPSTGIRVQRVSFKEKHSPIRGPK